MHQTEQHSDGLISGDRSSLLLFSAVQPAIHSSLCLFHVIHVVYVVMYQIKQKRENTVLSVAVVQKGSGIKISNLNVGRRLKAAELTLHPPKI